MFHLYEARYGQAILPTRVDTRQAKNGMLSFRFKSFVERPGGNFGWQGLKDWLLKIKSISLL